MKLYDADRRMKNIVFVASHLGYRMDRTPLGGGAMVGLQLVRHWAGAPGVRLTVLGSGSHPPDPGAAYLQLPSRREDPDLVRLSEREYAAFCRGFESATTEHILGGGAGQNEGGPESSERNEEQPNPNAVHGERDGEANAQQHESYCVRLHLAPDAVTRSISTHGRAELPMIQYPEIHALARLEEEPRRHE